MSAQSEQLLRQAAADAHAARQADEDGKLEEALAGYSRAVSGLLSVCEYQPARLPDLQPTAAQYMDRARAIRSVLDAQCGARVQATPPMQNTSALVVPALPVGEAPPLVFAEAVPADQVEAIVLSA